MVRVAGRAKKVRVEKIFILSLFLGIFLIAFVCITLGNMFYTQAMDISALIEAAKDVDVLEAIWISISAAFIATLIAFIFGTPLAYFLARKEFFGKSIIEGVVDVPLMIPHIVAGIAIYGVFMRHGIIGAPLNRIGIVFQDAFAGIVVAMLFVSFPFFVNAAKEGFKDVDARFERVARSLGASQFRTFFEVTFPLASRSILSGAIMCWGRAISEFSAVLIIASFPRSAPVLIYERFTSFGLRYAVPVSVLLISICLLIFIILRILSTKKLKKTEICEE